MEENIKKKTRSYKLVFQKILEATNKTLFAEQPNKLFS